MWIFLNDSMLSIVADRNAGSRLLVRARKAGDIERVFPRVKVTVTPDADYRFRASIPRGRVIDLISAQVRAIDYTNFKASVKDRGRHDAYMSVWSEMLRYQAHEAFGGLLEDAKRKGPKRAPMYDVDTALGFHDEDE